MQESKKVSIRLPKSLLKRLEEAKWSKRKSVTLVLIEALEAYLKESSIPEKLEIPESARVLATSWPI
jgi:predicted DNA-binding protein